MGGRVSGGGRAKPETHIDISTSGYGDAIPVYYGVVRGPSNLIWLSELANIQGSRLTFPTPGSGFGGAAPQGDLKTFYFISMLIALGEGPIRGVRTMYKRDTRFRVKKFDEPNGVGIIDPPNFSGKVYTGTANQPAWNEEGGFFDEHGQPIGKRISPPSPALAYPYLAYIARHLWPLYQQAQLPNLTFEIAGLAIDNFSHDYSEFQAVAGSGEPPTPVPDLAGFPAGANPVDIIRDMLTNPIHGRGDFPSEMLDAEFSFSGDPFGSYRTACRALGFQLGLACTDQKDTGKWISDILEVTHAVAVWSEGWLRFKPLYDSVVKGPSYHDVSQQVTFVPPDLEPDPQGEYTLLRVQYELTEDDFLPFDDDEDIVIVVPEPIDNIVTVEYRDRHANHAEVPVTYEDRASIEIHGRRPADNFEAHALTDGFAAMRLAQLRATYGPPLGTDDESPRPRYKFRLDWRYILLDPGDLVALTHAKYPGLERLPVMILSIDEQDEDQYDIVAEEVVTGLSAAVEYPRQRPTPTLQRVDAQPGRINPPIIFEPTAALGGGKLELWVGASGVSEDWGGCRIWLSEDNGITFKEVGRIDQACRQGRLMAALTDSASALDVLMGPAELPISLDSLTVAESIRFSQPIFIDSGTDATIPYELLSYAGTPALTGDNRYTVSLLRRAGLGTAAQQHRKGANVCVLDEAILKLSLRAHHLDPSSYLALQFKFTSFNRFGAQEESIEDVAPVTYRVIGTALRTPVGAINNLVAQFVTTAHGGQLQLTWDTVQDLRGDVVYEIRRGATSWARAPVLGTTRESRFAVVADAVYYVAARVSITDFGEPRYLYGAPAAIVIKGTADLVENVVQGFDEFASRWGDYRAGVLATKPDHYWRMGAYPQYPDIVDDLTGTVVGGATLAAPLTSVSQYPGAIVNALIPGAFCLRLDSPGDLVTLSASSKHDLAGDTWSMLLWFKHSSDTTRQYLYSKGSGAWLTIETSGKLRWLSATGGTQIDGVTGVRDGNWHFAVLSFRKYNDVGVQVDELMLTLDDTMQGKVTGATFPVATGTTYLGNQGSPAGGQFRGWLDEYAMVDQWLSFARARSFWRAGHQYAAGIYENFVRHTDPRVVCRFAETPILYVPNEIASGPPMTSPAATPTAGLLAHDTDGAYSFAATQRATAATPYVGNVTAFGISCLIKPTALANQWAVGLTDGALTDGPYLRLTSAGAIEAHFPRVAGGENVVTAPGAYAPSEIRHLYADCDGVTTRLFVNGTQVGSAAATAGLIKVASAYAQMGGGIGSLASYTGVGDELSLHTTLLSAAAVKNLASTALSSIGLTNLTVTGAGYVRALPGTTGYFQVPDDHIVTLARRMLVRVTAGWDAVAVGPDSIRDVPNFNALGQVKILDAAPLIDVQPEISISDEATGSDWTGGGTRPEWAPLRAANYLARRIRLRMKVQSKAEGIIAELRQFTWAVDVPDLVLTGTRTTSASGVVSVTYQQPFHQAPGLVVTLRNAPTGGVPELVRYVNETATGFEVEVITAGGARVAREISWIAQGF